MATIRSIILAANRLPATLVQTDEGERWQTSPGGMAAALTPVQKKWHATWIGWSGLHETSDNAVPFSPGLQGLQIGADDYNRYYNVVANGALWPAFHGLEPQTFSNADWQAYQAVNKQFAEAIAATAAPDDLIWIHDFHLLLVPQFLRELGLQNRIGLFLHIPFAGAEHLAFPQARALINGLMHLDLCGVQTERDARKLHACLTTFFPGTALPRIEVFPIGIDFQHYQDALAQPGVKRELSRVQTVTQGKYVVLSPSRLDYTKGIITQLRAVERAVQNGLKNVYYKVIVSPSRERVEAYQTLKTAIDTEVARLARTIPGVVDYQYRNADFNELCAWFARADACLVAPIIDGMNLVAKEYLAVKPQTQDGVLILSSRAGAARQLDQALLVDPTDIDAIAAALLQAQSMPVPERHARAQAIRESLARENVFWWAERFIAALHS